MKRVRGTRGFTLVELIIVLVVIGILAAFIVVSYVGITEKARRNSLAFNAQTILRTIKVKKSTDDSFIATDVDETNLAAKLGMSAENYSEVKITLYNNDDYAYVVGQKVFSDLVACGTQDSIKVYSADNDECPVGGSPYSVEPIADSTPNGLGGGGANCTDPYLIESIDDLVYLSQQVNGGNTYSTKCIKLMVDLDFLQSKSYYNASRTDFGDINGNGTVEGLKKELTTAKGFDPIGNYSTTAKYFAGTFIGKTKSLYNLYINRPTTNYVGFFGYNKGTITALNLTNINVTGADRTGGVSGHNENYVTDIILSGNVTGTNYTGGAVGSQSGYGCGCCCGVQAVSGIVFSGGSVTGTDSVGGISGFHSTSPVLGVVDNVTITSTGGSVGRIFGSDENGGGPYKSGLATASVTVNGSPVSSTNSESKHGSTVSDLAAVMADVNLAETVLDTYIAGDNDGNGYYWDYGGSNLVQKSVTTDPLTFGLSGSGTSGDPYIINNVTDLKQATLQLSKYYKLNADINLSGQKFYMFGSYYNHFTGTFQGANHTITNMTINAAGGGYIGFSGYNAGTITALGLSSINVTGGNHTGGVTGHNYNYVTDIILSGNVTGASFTGGVAGSQDSYGCGCCCGVQAVSGIIFSNGSVTGADYVGGISGHHYNSPVLGLVEDVTIIATGGNVGRIFGANGDGGGGPYKSGLATASVTINGSPVSSTDSENKHGSTVSGLAAVMADVNLAETVLDTYIAGDNDGNGFYWDYSGSTLVEKSVAADPLTFGLSGAGTSGDPYLINNTTDLKQATLQLSKYFKLNADIDLSGQKFYMFGSYYNHFTGTFHGNNHTVSNMAINAPGGGYIGFSGYNSGTITALGLSDIDVVGGNRTGGVVGHNYNYVTDIIISGNVTGANYTGGVAGSQDAYGCGCCCGLQAVSGIIFSGGSVTGADYVGGISGHHNNSPILGVIDNVSVISTGGNVGRIFGANGDGGGGPYKSGLATPSVTVNGSAVVSSDSESKHGSTTTSLAAVMADVNLAETVMDTYIAGDNDGNGYYWDYSGSSLVEKSVATDPLTFGLSGSGTSGDPYLINNVTDLKQATLQLSKYFKLNADINLSGQKFYMFGSYPNKFTGTFHGANHTISNMTVNASGGGYIGFSGYNSGIIKGLVLSNMNVIGGNHTGGVVGHNYNYVSDIVLSGNVTGANYTGGAAGSQDGYGGGCCAGVQNVTSIVFSGGSVTGGDSVGGISGHHSSSPVIGVIDNVAIIATGGNVGRIYGSDYAGGGPTKSGSAVASNVTINGSTVSSTDPASRNGLNITSGDLSNSATYTARGFNFTDEALDYIWYIDGSLANFREGTL